MEDLVWIGLSYNESVGGWVWEESGRKASDGYTNWAPDEPGAGNEVDGMCVGLQVYRQTMDGPELEWKVNECSSNNPAICEITLERKETCGSMEGVHTMMVH